MIKQHSITVKQKTTKKEIQVICGCFRGDLEDFEKAILKTHKDNALYRKQYLKELEKVKILFDLEEVKKT